MVQDPHRIEIISIMVVDVVGANLVNKGVIFEMVRDAEENLADLRLVDKFTEQQEHTLESPLLMAFFEGFRFGGIEESIRLN